MPQIRKWPGKGHGPVLPAGGSPSWVPRPLCCPPPRSHHRGRSTPSRTASLPAPPPAPLMHLRAGERGKPSWQTVLGRLGTHINRLEPHHSWPQRVRPRPNTDPETTQALEKARRAADLRLVRDIPGTSGSRLASSARPGRNERPQPAGPLQGMQAAEDSCAGHNGLLEPPARKQTGCAASEDRPQQALQTQDPRRRDARSQGA